MNGMPELSFNKNEIGRAKNELRKKLSQTINQKKLFKYIDSIPELRGAAVIYIDSKDTLIELRAFTSTNNLKPIKVVLREPSNMMNQKEFASYLKGNQGNAKESRLVGEIAGTALSCGAAFLGWIVVLGSSAAIPVTGGTSAAITYLSIGAASASTGQCLNGLYRTNNEIFSPEKNDWLDSQEWYQNTMTSLDVISIAGAAAAGAATLKATKLLMANGQTTASILNGFSRAQRKQLTTEIIRLNSPAAAKSNQVLKRLVNSGAFPKRYTGIQITQALKLQIKDGIGASMSFSGSALSGSLHSVAIGIYEELDQ